MVLRAASFFKQKVSGPPKSCKLAANAAEKITQIQRRGNTITTVNPEQLNWGELCGFHFVMKRN